MFTLTSRAMTYRTVRACAATVAVFGLLGGVAWPASEAVKTFDSEQVAPAVLRASEGPRTASCAPQARPAIVLVHGAWADISSWGGEMRILREQGYEVRAITIPLGSPTSDAETVASELQTIPRPVVLVGHAYGGTVITNAAAHVDNVRALVYVDAVAPAPGETNRSLSGPQSVLNAPAEVVFDRIDQPDSTRRTGKLYLKKKIFLDHLGQNLPAPTATDLWAAQRLASIAALDAPSRYAAWQTIPSWYFISTGDRIITPQSELRMARRARSRVTVFHGGSHLTLVSHPHEVAKVITDAARTVR